MTICSIATLRRRRGLQSDLRASRNASWVDICQPDTVPSRSLFRAEAMWMAGGKHGRGRAGGGSSCHPSA